MTIIDTKTAVQEFFPFLPAHMCRLVTNGLNIYLKDNFGSGSRSQIISAPPAPTPAPQLWFLMFNFKYTNHVLGSRLERDL